MKKKALQQHPKQPRSGDSPSPTQIAEFLEAFRMVTAASTNSKSRLISLKVPEDLLRAFQVCAQKDGFKYQTKIKELMREYVLKGSGYQI